MVLSLLSLGCSPLSSSESVFLLDDGEGEVDDDVGVDAMEADCWGPIIAGPDTRDGTRELEVINDSADFVVSSCWARFWSMPNAELDENGVYIAGATWVFWCSCHKSYLINVNEHLSHLNVGVEELAWDDKREDEVTGSDPVSLEVKDEEETASDIFPWKSLSLSALEGVD